MIFVNVWSWLASNILEMEYFGTGGQLSLLVIRVLTLVKMGLDLPSVPVMNSLSVMVAKWL